MLEKAAPRTLLIHEETETKDSRHTSVARVCGEESTEKKAETKECLKKKVMKATVILSQDVFSL